MGHLFSAESKRKHEWDKYNRHKTEAHDYFNKGQESDKTKNWEQSCIYYNQAVESRSKADGLWIILNGPAAADIGHAKFMMELLRYRNQALHKCK